MWKKIQILLILFNNIPINLSIINSNDDDDYEIVSSISPVITVSKFQPSTTVQTNVVNTISIVDEEKSDIITPSQIQPKNKVLKIKKRTVDKLYLFTTLFCIFLVFFSCKRFFVSVYNLLSLPRFIKDNYNIQYEYNKYKISDIENHLTKKTQKYFNMSVEDQKSKKMEIFRKMKEIYFIPSMMISAIKYIRAKEIDKKLIYYIYAKHQPINYNLYVFYLIVPVSSNITSSIKLMLEQYSFIKVFGLN